MALIAGDSVFGVEICIANLGKILPPSRTVKKIGHSPFSPPIGDISELPPKQGTIPAFSHSTSITQMTSNRLVKSAPIPQLPGTVLEKEKTNLESALRTENPFLLLFRIFKWQGLCYDLYPQLLLCGHVKEQCREAMLTSREFSLLRSTASLGLRVLHGRRD